MVIRPVLLVASMVLFAVSPIIAQEPDSLANRIERLERLVDILQTQVAENAGTGVTTRSRNPVEISGLILVNGYTNNGNPFMDDVPQFVLAPAAAGQLPTAGASAAVRQTRLTVSTQLDGIFGSSFFGELDMDFFGGQHPSSGGRTFPNLRIRTTRAQFDWPNASIMIGQDAPPIVQINPSSFAAMGFPGFTGAGNLWLWLPQVRAGVHTNGSIRVGLEVAALAPSTGEKQPDPMYTSPDQAERSRRPYTQGRMTVAWGEPGDGGEVSAGAHYGWYATTTPGQYLISKAAAGYAQFNMTRYVEVRGEVFAGQGLRGLGGGGIYQNMGSNGVMLRSRGGWVQLNFLPNEEWEIGGGTGLDDPDNADFDPADFTPTFGRLQNISYEGHIHWRPFPLVFALEFRQLRTRWGLFTELVNNHVNVAAGFEF